MNNNINVPIMGVTTKHKEYEQRIINDLRKQLLNDKSKINLIDVSRNYSKIILGHLYWLLM